MSRLLAPLTVTLLSLTPFSSLNAAVSVEQGNAGLTVIRGRGVCLDAGGKPVESLFACSTADARYGFAGKEGKLYRFVANDAIAAVFSDVRVRQRDIQLTARLHPGDRLEIIKVQSVRAGSLYDIYYFCEVCNIRAYTPGPCPCCRNELEFRETPP